MSVFNQIKHLAYESLIYGISGAIARFIGIFLIPVYTKIFSPSDYGIIALISSFTDLIGMFMVLGLDNSSARWFYDSEKESDRKYTISSWFWCQLSVSFVFAVGLFSTAYLISDIIFKSRDYAILIKMAVLSIPFGTFIKVFGNLLRYQRRAWTTSIFSTANSILTIGTILLLIVVYKWGLIGIYAARLLAAATIALVAFFMLNDWISTDYFSLKRLKEMLAFGLPLVPATIASWITFSSDRFILQIFHDTSEVGLYSIAASLASGVALFTGAFQLAWGPFAFSIYREKESLDVYSKVFSLYALVFCCLGTAVSLFSPLLLRILTTAEYYRAHSCVPFLVFSYIAIGATYILSLGSGIAKKSKPIALSIFIGAVVNIILNFLFIPILGKDGAAVATLLANAGGAIYLYIASQRNYQIPYKLKHAIVCFGFSFILIAINYLFISNFGVKSFILRICMCCMFIPLAFWLGLVELANVKHLYYFVSHRITASSS